MPGEPPCEFLPWDSEFFRLRIGRVVPTALSAAAARSVDAWCARESMDCVYFLCRPKDAESCRRAQSHGFNLVDVRVTLQAARPEMLAESVLPDAVRSVRPADLPLLKEIARVGHRSTRFYADHHFSRESCDALYATWIENSCTGFAQSVFVAESDGQPGGYVTCHRELGNRGRIGLLAVAEPHRGKGLGAQLVRAALDWCARDQAASCTVATQGRNVGAQRLYLHCGFRLHTVELWYHKWIH